jgi:outer membrane protein assembly factor BamB
MTSPTLGTFLMLAALLGMAASLQADVIQQHKLISFSPGIAYQFGSSVSADGNLAVIGETLGGAGGSNIGTAQIFNVETGARLRTLRAADASYVDVFGSSVGISGITVIVGSPQNDDVSPTDVNCQSGSAYIFDALTGQQRFKFTASDAAEASEFGHAVAIDGDRAIIGAHYHRVGAKGAAGQSYVFDVTTGQELLKLVPSDLTANAVFGSAVAMDGSTAIIASQRSAYLFDVTTGQELFKLTTSDQVFIGSVAIDGPLAIVGAENAAYVFDVVTGQQLRKLTLSNPLPNEVFGSSVAIQNNLAVVSSQQRIADSGFRHGAAYLFDATTGQQLFRFEADGPVTGDAFSQVTIAGDKIVVGARFADGPLVNDIYGRGAAYVFEFEAVPEPHALLLLSTAFLGSYSFGRLRNS